MSALRRGERPDLDSPKTLGLRVALATYAASTVVESVVVGQGGRISRLTAGALIVVVVLSRIGRRGEVFPGSALIAPWGLGFLAVLSTFWSVDADLSVGRSFTLMAIAVTSTAVAAACADLGRNAVATVAWGLVVGAAAASAMVVWARISGTFVSTSEWESLAQRSTAGAADPNDLALALAMCVPVAIWVRPRLVGFPIAALALGAVLLTGSRGAVVALAAGAVAYVSMQLVARGAKIAQLFAVVGVLVASGYVAWSLLPAPLVRRFVGIPTELSSGTLSSRRIIWRGAIDQIVQTPISGTGAGTSPEVISRWTGLDLIAHNTQLALLLEYGLLGWGLFVVGAVIAFRAAFRLVPTVPWLLPQLAILITGTLALSWDSSKLLWLVLVFAGVHGAVTSGKFGTEPRAMTGYVLGRGGIRG